MYGGRGVFENTDIALFTSSEHSQAYLFAVENLPPAIFFDDHDRNFLDMFISGKAPLTVKTFPAASYYGSILAKPGIHNLVVYLTAIRAFHGHSPFWPGLKRLHSISASINIFVLSSSA